MMKMPEFYIPDLHIGHKKRYSTRRLYSGRLCKENFYGAEMLSQLKGKKYLILGNNENYDLLNTFPEENWG
jgi:hypothetical protein